MAPVRPSRTPSQIRWGQEDTHRAISTTASDGFTLDDVALRLDSSTCNPPFSLPYFEDFEGASASTYTASTSIITGVDYWSFSELLGVARLRLAAGTGFYKSGSRAMTVDSETNNVWSQSDSILELPMGAYDASCDTVHFAFSWTEHGDEIHTQDKIYARGSDTDAWVQVYDWGIDVPVNGTYVDITGIDISGALQSAVPVQNFSDTFQIRFAWYDNYQASSVSGQDGRSFDDVGLTLNSTTCGGGGGASVGDVVFADTDGDGVQDAGEPGMLGVTVELQHAGCTPSVNCPTQVTIASGAYNFTGLAAGTYTVDVVDSTLPPSATLTTSNDPTVVVLSAAETRTDVDFGYQSFGSITGEVFRDFADDAVFSFADPVLAGVLVELQTSTCTPGSTCPTTTTNNNGIYSFNSVAAGNVTIDVIESSMPATSTTTVNEPQALLVEGDQTTSALPIGVDYGTETAVTLPLGEDFEGTSGETYIDLHYATLTGVDPHFSWKGEPGEGRLRMGVPTFANNGAAAATLDGEGLVEADQRTYLIFTANLSNYDANVDQVMLDFGWMHHGATAETTTRVWIRACGTCPWRVLFDPTGGIGAGLPIPNPGVYSNESVDVSAFLVSNSENFTADTNIVFGVRMATPAGSDAVSLTANAGLSYDDFCLRLGSMAAAAESSETVSGKTATVTAFKTQASPDSAA